MQDHENSMLSSKNVSLTIEDDGWRAVIKLDYHKSLKDAKAIFDQRMGDLKTKFEGKEGEDDVLELNRLAENLVDRRKAERMAIIEEEKEYKDTSLKGVFRLSLPCQVLEEIPYQKVHDLGGRILVVDLECVEADKITKM
jgi:hypothetical protein